MHDRGEPEQLGIEGQPDLASPVEVHLEADTAIDDAQIDDATQPAEIRLITDRQNREMPGALEQADIWRRDVQDVTVVDDFAAAEGSDA